MTKSTHTLATENSNSHYSLLLRNLAKRVQNSTMLRGTIILTVTGLLTRCIGFYNRIFLNSKIGATQLGLYQLVLPVYMLSFSLTTYGKEIALTKLVSEHDNQGDYVTSKGYLKLCLFIGTLQGILTGLIVYLFASFICIHFLHTKDCINCLRILSVGIPFMSVKGTIHGYFLGKGRSGIHGASDLLEQVTKIVSLYLLSSFVLIQKTYSASFACLGIMFGEIVSFLFCLGALFYNEKKVPKYRVPHLSNTSPASIHNSLHNKCLNDSFSKLSVLLKTSLPLTLNRCSLAIFQSIEAVLIPSTLLHYYHKSTLSLSIYGLFTGISFPCVMFPSTLTNSLSTMLLPVVSASNKKTCASSLSTICEKSIQLCLYIGIYSLILFYIFGIKIGTLLFHSTDAGYYLRWLSLLCPFLYLATTLASILNGLGHSTHNLLFNLISTGIRILFIVCLVPKMGIVGYVLGLFFSYCTLTLTSLAKIEDYIPLHFQFRKWILQPFIKLMLLNMGLYYLYSHFLPLYTSLQAPILLFSLLLSAFLSLLPVIKNTFTC